MTAGNIVISFSIPPSFLENRRRFFAAHCPCTLFGALLFIVEQSRLAQVSYGRRGRHRCAGCAGLGAGDTTLRRVVGRLPGCAAGGCLFRRGLLLRPCGRDSAEHRPPALAGALRPVPGVSAFWEDRTKAIQCCRCGGAGVGRRDGHQHLHRRLASSQLSTCRVADYLLPDALWRVLGCPPDALDGALGRDAVLVSGDLWGLFGGHCAGRILAGLVAGLSAVHRADRGGSPTGVHRPRTGTTAQSHRQRTVAGDLPGGSADAVASAGPSATGNTTAGGAADACRSAAYAYTQRMVGRCAGDGIGHRTWYAPQMAAAVGGCRGVVGSGSDRRQLGTAGELQARSVSDRRADGRVGAIAPHPGRCGLAHVPRPAGIWLRIQPVFAGSTQVSGRPRQPPSPGKSTRLHQP